jgi:hypothetical protein
LGSPRTRDRAASFHPGSKYGFTTTAFSAEQVCRRAIVVWYVYALSSQHSLPQNNNQTCDMVEKELSKSDVMCDVVSFDTGFAAACKDK